MTPATARARRTRLIMRRANEKRPAGGRLCIRSAPLTGTGSAGHELVVGTARLLRLRTGSGLLALVDGAEVGVDLGPVRVLVGRVDDGVDRALGLASAAVDALVGVDRHPRLTRARVAGRQCSDEV